MVSAHWEAWPTTLGATRTVPSSTTSSASRRGIIGCGIPLPGPALAARVREVLRERESTAPRIRARARPRAYVRGGHVPDADVLFSSCRCRGSTAGNSSNSPGSRAAARRGVLVFAALPDAHMAYAFVPASRHGRGVRRLDGDALSRFDWRRSSTSRGRPGGAAGAATWSTTPRCSWRRAPQRTDGPGRPSR